MAGKPIDAEVVASWLSAHPTWSLRDGKLHKRYSFPDFRAAFDWMTRVAERAEAMNHHPEWLNVYTQVTVWLETHDTQGLTALDLALAEDMDRLFV